LLTFTPPESALSGQFWGIYALLAGVRVKSQEWCIVDHKRRLENKALLVSYILYN